MGGIESISQSILLQLLTWRSQLPLLLYLAFPDLKRNCRYSDGPCVDPAILESPGSHQRRWVYDPPQQAPWAILRVKTRIWLGLGGGHQKWGRRQGTERCWVALQIGKTIKSRSFSRFVSGCYDKLTRSLQGIKHWWVFSVFLLTSNCEAFVPKTTKGCFTTVVPKGVEFCNTKSHFHLQTVECFIPRLWDEEMEEYYEEETYEEIVGGGGGGGR